MSRSALLERDRRLAAERRDEAEHEVLRRQVDDVPAGLRQPRRARDRVEKVRLAAPDAGVDVERVVTASTCRPSISATAFAAANATRLAAPSQNVSKV